MFDRGSGRPSGKKVIETNLLARLRNWSRDFAGDSPDVPRAILLVGGPGNGKTDSIERVIHWLDEDLGLGGALIDELAKRFSPAPGQAVDRLISVDLGLLSNLDDGTILDLVQDASARAGGGGKPAHCLLVEDLETALVREDRSIYLCCVNRGVLDDALIAATEQSRQSVVELLQAVTTAVGLGHDAPSCWPLDGFEKFAVWPMDMETLLVSLDDPDNVPAGEIIDIAVDVEKWPAHGECHAGELCPFCASRSALGQELQKVSLLQLLRWFELSSGKRWSFRDLFTLLSYLLAGQGRNYGQDLEDPCKWAAELARSAEVARTQPSASRKDAAAIFDLLASQYQHALFHSWDADAGSSLAGDLRLLGLAKENTGKGLAHFLSSRASTGLPAMIAPSLIELCEALDPALADPDDLAGIGDGIRFREFDARFSRSVESGLRFCSGLGFLTPIEDEVLQRLQGLDARLSDEEIRRSRPAVAKRVQQLVRDFSCRVVRRSLGARSASVLDKENLADFENLTQNRGGRALEDAARKIEELLNKGGSFGISLTTTFGQPMPPQSRRAMLFVAKQVVEVPEHSSSSGRPVAPLSFLRIGEEQASQPIALTYDLFKAVRQLEQGMSSASLPTNILAMMDATRARLAGQIVRDEKSYSRGRGRIELGSTGKSIEMRQSTFELSRGD